MKCLPIVIIGFLLVVVQCAFAQNESDSIMIKTGFRMKFVYHNEIYTRVDALDILQANSAAEKKMKNSIITSSIGRVIRFSGAVLVMIPIGEKIQGKHPNWASALIGVGLLSVSMPFAGISASSASKAVNIYNSGLNLQGVKYQKYQFGLTTHGIGLTVRL
jgi:hypothetical protein